MCQKAIYFVVALSSIILLPLRVISQDANDPNRTRETPTQRGICRSNKVIGPAVQNARTALGKSTRIATFEEGRDNLSEFNEAEEFMQLKADVFADLNRLEESSHAKPKRDTVRDGDSAYLSAGNVTVNRETIKAMRESPAQAESPELSASSTSAGSSKP
jgi:hypothetical protein